MNCRTAAWSTGAARFLDYFEKGWKFPATKQKSQAATGLAHLTSAPDLPQTFHIKTAKTPPRLAKDYLIACHSPVPELTLTSWWDFCIVAKHFGVFEVIEVQHHLTVNCCSTIRQRSSLAIASDTCQFSVWPRGRETESPPVAS